MRFTRHAKQRLKLYRVSRTQAAAIVRWEEPANTDARGNPIYHGWIGRRPIRIVVAMDDPELVITVYERRRTP